MEIQIPYIWLLDLSKCQTLSCLVFELFSFPKTRHFFHFQIFSDIFGLIFRLWLKYWTKNVQHHLKTDKINSLQTSIQDRAWITNFQQWDTLSQFEYWTCPVFEFPLYAPICKIQQFFHKLSSSINQDSK